MKKIIRTIFKLFSILLLLLLIVFVGMNFSPIYRFAPAQPFHGQSIYNPYISLDTTIGWKKANFHTHTKVDKGINECPEYPDVVWKDYQKYGYDILSFSNHNALTTFPDDSTRQISLYEHGYNVFKFHKLVFGSKKVMLFDNMLPILPSQKQFMFDLLEKDADLLVFNHPDRTFCVSKKDMERVTGYQMMEAFCGPQTDLIHWDEALSSGHYSYILINDDCHDSGNPKKIAIRCSFLNAHSHLWEEVRTVLEDGCFYTMSIPDLHTDIEKKIELNHSLPFIKWIGMKGDTISLSLSEPAKYIRVIGQNGENRDSIVGSDVVNYAFQKKDTYIRLMAAFENGVIIYSNPFARHLYEDLGQEELFAPSPHPIRWGATIAFSALLLLIISGLAYLIKRIITRWRS